MLVHLGEFEIATGKVVVSDPCYKLGSDQICMGMLDQVVNGMWRAQVEKTEVRDWGEVNAKITAYHHSFVEQLDHLLWVKCPFVVGVDSGQAGIFDAEKYRVPDAGAQSEASDADSDWYLACCDITESAEEAGVLEGGVVSRSGMGDGGYGAYYAVNEQQQVIAVKIVFMKVPEWQ
ncbi:DUF4241 domain-containing protein [Paenibacillus turpanensis]|uniref:DUF4241 domain-containing protein n=1 Tax=Paenibacillus turpanensis TaxID=2689078 RepID=UPI001407A34D|nr:DUF4241 domain-containing protein [Paenibacillus turpanensis]